MSIEKGEVMGRWAARSKTQAKAKRPVWRSVLASVFIFLSVICLTVAVVVRYANDNIVNSERYIEMIGSLPQEPAVATALGTFTADRLFNSGTVQTEIAGFLSDKLSPAAPLLTKALQQQVADVATDVAASNTFTNAWQFANRTAHEALVAVAHSEPLEPRQDATVNLKLNALFDTVRERFGGDDGSLLNPEQQHGAADLVVNVRQSAQQLRTTVSIIEIGAWLLPLLGLALLAGAAWAANNRRRAVVGFGLLMATVAGCCLLAFRLSSQKILESFEQPVYRDAAQVIYETLYGNLRARLVGLCIAGLLVVLATLLFGPYKWAAKVREVLHLPR